MSVIDVGECARDEWRRAKQYGARANQIRHDRSKRRRRSIQEQRTSRECANETRRKKYANERAVAGQIMAIETK
jgi:hypothetical protein